MKNVINGYQPNNSENIDINNPPSGGSGLSSKDNVIDINLNIRNDNLENKIANEIKDWIPVLENRNVYIRISKYPNGEYVLYLRQQRGANFVKPLDEKIINLE